MSKKVKITGIPVDKEVTIKITGLHYAYIQALLIRILDSLGPDKVKEALTKLSTFKEGDVLEPHEQDIDTLYVLIGLIEKAAKEQNLEASKEVDVPEDLPSSEN